MTSQQIIEDILSRAGVGSSNYALDQGLNTVGFAWFEKGQTAGEIRKMYQRDLMLDRNKLEEASQNQVMKFERWYNLMEELAADVADCDLNLKRLKSSLSLKLRAKSADQLESD